MAILDALATINSPTTKPVVDRLRVGELRISRNTMTATVVVERINSDDTSDGSYDSFTFSTLADISDLMVAIGTPRAGETGAVNRRFNFRVLGFLVDSGRLSGVTINP